MSPHIRSACGIFRRRSAEPSTSLRAERSNPCLHLWRGGLLRRFAPRNDAERERASPRRQNRPLDLAKSDAVAVALAPAAHHERIAVLQERPFHARRKLDRLGPVPAYLQQAATLVLLRPRDGATP